MTFIVKPIRNEDDFHIAMAELERLFDQPEKSDTDYDQLELLGIVVQAYEKEHWPIGPPHPIAAIEHAMDARGLTRRDLEPFLGGSGRVSEIMNRQRPLSITMIRKINHEFGIPMDILAAAYPLEGKRERLAA